MISADEAIIDAVRRLGMDVELTVRRREKGVGTFEVRELVFTGGCV